MFSNRGLERYLRKQDYMIFSKIFFKLEHIINDTIIINKKYYYDMKNFFYLLGKNPQLFEIEA
jgi:hypothetical protein